MKENEVRSRAYAMPLTSPAYPVGPYRFCNREYLIITYRTDASLSDGKNPVPNSTRQESAGGVGTNIRDQYHPPNRKQRCGGFYKTQKK
jgi:hypothetical protein